MASPSSYTEETLATYAHTSLGAVADVLEWTVADGDYDEIVNEALLAYGADDIATISGTDNIRKLRVLMRREVWRKVMTETALDYRISTGGETLDRQQAHEHAKAMFEQAEGDAAEYGDTARYSVGVDTIEHIHDPYQYWPDERRVRP
jgi:hypothetical protein